MAHLPKIAIAICIAACLAYGNSDAREAPKKIAPQSAAVEPNPFEKYHRVANGIYVYDRSQFTRYVGPVLSPWKSDPEDGVVERKRLGTISVAPGFRATIELVAYPMSENYELRDTKTGGLIHEFSYFATNAAPLLFTGQGVLYQYARIDPLCWGPVTRKFEFIEGKLIETPQAILLLNAETELLRNVKLFSKPNESGSVVASLPKGTKVTVITYESPDRFLLKTPLGLTGWLINDGPSFESSLSITQCN